MRLDAPDMANPNPLAGSRPSCSTLPLLAFDWLPDFKLGENTTPAPGFSRLSFRSTAKSSEIPSTTPSKPSEPLPLPPIYHRTPPSCLVNDPPPGLLLALPFLPARLLPRPSSSRLALRPPTLRPASSIPSRRCLSKPPSLRAPACSARSPALLRTLHPQLPEKLGLSPPSPASTTALSLGDEGGRERRRDKRNRVARPREWHVY